MTKPRKQSVPPLQAPLFGSGSGESCSPSATGLFDPAKTAADLAWASGAVQRTVRNSIRMLSDEFKMIADSYR